VDIGQVLQWCARFASGADGVTITGGEPLDQVAPLEEFVQGLKESEALEHLDVLLYSGYSLGEAKLRSPLVFDIVDASITEPFVSSQMTDLVWRGSGNQVLTMLTDRGRQLFGPFVNKRAKEPEIQLSIASGTVWSVGIPRGKTMPNFKRAMNDHGVVLKGCSWQR
jgi:anaerobic ribonucleoside-triphosphate reductase activating protein